MAYYNPATAESEEDFYLGVASEMVQRFAPVPDPLPVDYAQKAERAERLLFNYLSSTQGASLTSVSAEAGSLSFTDVDTTKAIIRQSMGKYYTAGLLRTRYIERG